MRLVVLSPALHSNLKRWDEVIARLALEPGYGGLSQQDSKGPGEAHFLPVPHHTRLWTPGSLTRVSENFANRIQQKWERDGPYEDIVLVGHSIGGVIVRRAYLVGFDRLKQNSRVQWPKRVSRIVLFAALNRGVDAKRTLSARFLYWVTRVLPLPHLRLEDVAVGSTFITNLRIDWIRHFSRLAGLVGEPPPPDMLVPEVVQLVGDQDGIVSPEDSRDVRAFANATEIQIPDADHKLLYRLSEAPDPVGRWALIRSAFVGQSAADTAAATAVRAQPRLTTAPIGAVNREMSTTFHESAAKPLERPTLKGGDSVAAAAAVNHVIFILHGIRASNVDDWVRNVEELIERRNVPGVRSAHPSYGYFTAMRFALPSVRRRNTRKFRDWYTELLADYPAAEFSMIAHSNGTYMLGQTLLETPGMQFRNVVLAGSVLPTTYPWDDLVGRGQVARVLNERANKDWPVALLCNALRGLRQRDVGTAGFAGFEGQDVQEVGWHAGDHGAALRGGNLERLVSFALDGRCDPAEGLVGPGIFRQLSNLAPRAGQLLVIGALLLIALWIATGSVFPLAGAPQVALAGGFSRLIVAAAALWSVYVVLDIV